MEVQENDFLDKIKDQCQSCGNPIPKSWASYVTNGNFCRWCNTGVSSIISKASREKVYQEIDKRRRVNNFNPPVLFDLIAELFKDTPRPDTMQSDIEAL